MRFIALSSVLALFALSNTSVIHLTKEVSSEEILAVDSQIEDSVHAELDGGFISSFGEIIE